MCFRDCGIRPGPRRISGRHTPTASPSPPLRAAMAIRNGGPRSDRASPLSMRDRCQRGDRCRRRQRRRSPTRQWTFAPAGSRPNQPEDEGEKTAGEDTDNSAQGTKHDGLERELKENIFLRGADGFAYSNLARALGHAHQHDIHHPDPADQRPDARDREQKDKQSAGERIPKVEQRVGGKDDEVVRLVGVQACGGGATVRGFHPRRQACASGCRISR